MLLRYLGNPTARRFLRDPELARSETGQSGKSLPDGLQPPVGLA
jgi:hypothetical protein